ncbi:TraR/DksA family transcriptional regulator [Thioclava sp.]|uniref:TraR/DksA family transcriptional regulator n=1 Tax=Thioclava sp. TaxID=1933450 RepID=UPI003AA86FA9
MKSDKTRRTEIEARKAHLLERIEEIDAELDSHVEQDWEDAASKQEDDEVLDELDMAARQELRVIEAALQRLDAGEYGFCVTCGERIDEARLDLLPATPFCRLHAPGAKKGAR